MSALTLTLNGQTRTFENLSSPAGLQQLIDTLGLKSDRIAVEQNHAIVPRSIWSTARIKEGDRLEIVHFVGGGTMHSA